MRVGYAFKRLGKQVSWILRRGNMDDINFSEFNMLPYVMVSDVNMFCLGMSFGILSK